mmetsp:Transcript_4749/g.7209  ORF Transcript_4749/g.7209 Transcript_4749/m.7209 type:complete len:416 (+) Transcript_4749:98-1345(+)
MSDPLKKTVKLGNWQEEKALESMMGGKTYDPKVRSSTALTNLRCIDHSAKVDARDYQSVLKDTHKIPQTHEDYNVAYGKGPRARLKEQMMKQQVESEFEERERQLESERNARFLTTTTQEAMSKDNFTSTLRDKISGMASGKKRDPYYLREEPITYYLHSALHCEEVSFPVTAVGSLEKPWSKGVSMSGDIKNGTLRHFGTFENSGNPPTVRELRILRNLRTSIVNSFCGVSPAGKQGSTVRLLTQQLLDLNNENIPRASVSAVDNVLSDIVGVSLSSEQCDALKVAFSRYNDDRIILVEFVEYIRGPLSQWQSDLIIKAFITCNPGEDDLVTDEGIINAFNTSGAASSPSAEGLSGKELLNHFLDSLQAYSYTSNGFELNDFVEYYRDVYCEMNNPELFEKTIIATWNIDSTDC